MAIKKGDKIKVDYTGTFEDGTVFDSSEGREPLAFEVGSGQLIKGFDAGVVGMTQGQEKTIKISPKEAYGDPNPELIRKFPRSSIPPEAKEGMMLALRTPDGQQLPAKISKLDEKDATIDLNHPLAGKTLHFKIKIVEVA